MGAGAGESVRDPVPVSLSRFHAAVSPFVHSRGDAEARRKPVLFLRGLRVSA